MQDRVEIVMKEPQTSKDAGLEALQREVKTLTEALKIQHLQNQVGETDFEEGFENPFAQPHHRWQDWALLNPRRGRVINPRSNGMKEPLDHQHTQDF